MATKLPPLPVGIPPGHSYFNDWYEKMRFILNNNLIVTTWANITGTPTTLAGYGITDSVEFSTNKNNASGYAGLNSVSRTTKGVDTTDDLVVDLTTKGLVLKDNAGTPHYWRVTVSAAGALVVTDIGTTKP
jgi:hypothetical protein